MHSIKLKLLVSRYRILIFLIITTAFVLPEVSVYFNRPARGYDIFGYLRAGSDALRAAPLYQSTQPGKNNTWPPFFSFFIIPLSLSASHWGIPITKELWYFFNFMCLIAVMQLWTDILYGTRPRFCSRFSFDFSSPKVFVPFLLLLPVFVNNFFMLQINVFILLLVTLGFFCLTKNRHTAGGLCFGLAAALKAFPVIVLLYLLIRRQWKTAVYMAAACIFFSCLPAISYGVDSFLHLVRQWLSISLFQTLIIDNERYNNQSLYAMWYRLLVYRFHLAEPGSLILKFANVGSIAIVTIISMGIFIRKKFDLHESRTPIEFAAMCVMMNLFSPIAWVHHFVFLYPAIAVVWWAYLSDSSFFRKGIYKYSFIIWAFLILLPYVFTKIIGTAFKAWSNYTIAALLLLFLLLRMTARARKQPLGIP